MNIIDERMIDVACGCGAAVKVKLGQIRKGATVTCPKGHNLDLNAKRFDDVVRDADESLAELERAIRNFGRARQPPP